MTGGIFSGIPEYIQKALESANPVWAAIITVTSYILFPTDAYIPAAIALGIAAMLDIITKYYSVAVKNGGLKKAIENKALQSERLWRGTYRKLVSYLVIMILAGLSVRVTMLVQVAVFFSTIVYAIMFLRESQSILENLFDAGHTDVEWLLFWVKRKQKDILNGKVEVKEEGEE